MLRSTLRQRVLGLLALASVYYYVYICIYSVDFV